ncbi:MAG: hypothetical protein V1672_05335, partial [Candidatus Diapherotrites archaeon]
MVGMDKIINEAVKSISALDSKRKILAQKILPLNSQIYPKLIEQKLILPVEKITLNGTMAGVDSGFVGKNLFALDLILIRAISAIFTYNENKLSKAEYLPNFFSFPEPH